MNETKQRILVIDDSRTSVAAVSKALTEALDLPIDVAASHAECSRLLDKYRTHYALAVVDLNLPDAPNGETLDLVLGNAVPAIVLTGTLDRALHDRISSKPIFDYVVKQNPGSIDAVQKGAQRILRNRQRKALIVDDSVSYRFFLNRLLQNQCLTVLEARDGADALHILQDHKDISIVITDYEMPNMDGIQLSQQLRKRYSASRLGVIALSAGRDPFLGVRFLKAGANDLVRKPFLPEEFVARINNCIDQLDAIAALRDQAQRDYLTRLYNRRYFYEAGGALFKRAQRGEMQLSCAMLDIDFFKKINDTYGHDMGDKAIVAVARTVQAAFAEDAYIVARMGGEEFCVLAQNCADFAARLEALRARIEALALPLEGDATLCMTISIGYSAVLPATLDELVNAADQALYAAKQGGRNRVAT